jgi:hypothetical protein
MPAIGRTPATRARRVAFPPACAALLACLLGASVARAQDIEPRQFSNAPVGVNFVILGYIDGRGVPSFDPAIPLTDVDLKTPTIAAAYARAMDLFGVCAKLDVVAPYTMLSGTGLYKGAPASRDVDGFGDTRVRLSVNVYGSPALELADFRSYKQRTIVGTSFQVSAPTGQYDPTRLVNIGANRWWFKPEVGVSRATGPWTMELAASATMYSDNNEFYNGHARSQSPLYSGQGHLIRGFKSGLWVALDANYFTGGRTTVDTDLSDDLQQNWRTGGVLAYPLGKYNSLKLAASFGVWARTGSNFDQIGLAWQYRWGGGL